MGACSRDRGDRMNHRSTEIQRFILFLSVSLCLWGSWIYAGTRQQSKPATTPTPNTQQYRALLDQYCTGCHNERSKTGGLAIDTMNLADVAGHGEVWEKAIRKLR